MRIVVIGGTGHIGSFLVPRLVNAGHELVVVSRNERLPYIKHAAWDSVQLVKLDRNHPLLQNSFGSQIAVLQPDIVIDMICFDKSSAVDIVNALRGKVKQYLFCGTIWVYGFSELVPTDETRPRRPLTAYGIGKAEAESYLLTEAHRHQFPVSIIHPGHIVGPGWKPVNPAGNLNPEIFAQLAHGERIILPNLGMETLHHVHADDVAQAFQLAIEHPQAANGQSFNILAPQAVTMRGYADKIAEWFGKKAEISFLDWDNWRKNVNEEDAAITWDHLIHSPCCSIEKARQLIGYQPKYTSMDAIAEALNWQIKHNELVL